MRSRVSTALAPVTSSKPAQVLARFGRAFRAIWQKRMRFSYAFYAIAFVITNAVAALFIQWSVYNEPTYADPNAVDETTKMLNSVRGQLTSFVSQMWLGGRYTFLLNFLVLGLFYLMLVFLFNRFWIATAVFSAIAIVFSVANRIKITLRGEPILPSDLSFIIGGNGGEIGTFIPKDAARLISTAITVLIIVVVVCIMLQFLDRRNYVTPFHWRKPFRNAKTIVGNCSRVLALLLSFVTLFSFTWTLGAPGSWSSVWAAKTANQNRSANITDSTVIMILSESFADPTRVPGVSFSEDPMPNIRNLKEQTTSGIMPSPGYGGGTANIEYQSLAGLNMALFDDSMQSMY